MTKNRLMTSLFSAGAMLTVAMGVATAGSAQAAAPKTDVVYGQRASIAFASNGGISDWYSNDERSIFLRGRNGHWYQATFSGPCRDLPYENTIGFETNPLGAFDDWGVVLTRNYRCHVEALVTSPAPAAKGGPSHTD